MNVRMQHIAIKHHVKKGLQVPSLYVRLGIVRNLKSVPLMNLLNLRKKYFGNAMQIM